MLVQIIGWLSEGMLLKFKVEKVLLELIWWWFFCATNRCLCLFFICDNFTCFKLKILNYFTEFHSSLLFIILCDFTYSTNYFFNFTNQFQLFPHIHHKERKILFFIHKHSINFPYAPQIKTQGNGSWATTPPFNQHHYLLITIHWVTG